MEILNFDNFNHLILLFDYVIRIIINKLIKYYYVIFHFNLKINII